MRVPVRLILLISIPVIAWLTLGMPRSDAIASAWLPAAVFIVFWTLTLFQGGLLRVAGVDLDVYGNSIRWFTILPCLLATFLGFAGFAAAIFGTASVRSALNSSSVLGLSILWLLGVLLVPVVFARHTLGVAGTRSIEDPRAPMHSSPSPPRSMAEFERGSQQEPLP